jgi:hypothetical protein
VSLRRDHFIPVDKAVNKKEQWGKGLEAEEEKKTCKKIEFAYVLYVYVTALVAWHSGQHIHLKNRKSWVQIPSRVKGTVN